MVPGPFYFSISSFFSQHGVFCRSCPSSLFVSGPPILCALEANTCNSVFVPRYFPPIFHPLQINLEKIGFISSAAYHCIDRQGVFSYFSFVMSQSLRYPCAPLPLLNTRNMIKEYVADCSQRHMPAHAHIRPDPDQSCRVFYLVIAM